MSKAINILFIDDDENLYIIYNKILKDNIKDKFNFDYIGTAEEIEGQIKDKHYDIIILDQKLNNGNKGLDFLPLIKKNDIYTYVIINSAYGNEKLATEAIRKGADDYVQGNKEDNDEFLEVINKAIQYVKRSKIIDDISNSFINLENKLENNMNTQITEIKNRMSEIINRKK